MYTPGGIHDKPSRDATTNRAAVSPGCWNTAHAHSHTTPTAGSFSAATSTTAALNSSLVRKPSPTAVVPILASLAATFCPPRPITGGGCAGAGAAGAGATGAAGAGAAGGGATLGVPAGGGAVIGIGPAAAGTPPIGAALAAGAAGAATGPAEDDVGADIAEEAGGGPAGIVEPGAGLNGCAPAADAPEATVDGDADENPCPTPFKNCCVGVGAAGADGAPPLDSPDKPLPPLDTPPGDDNPDPPADDRPPPPLIFGIALLKLLADPPPLADGEPIEGGIATVDGMPPDVALDGTLSPTAAGLDP